MTLDLSALRAMRKTSTSALTKLTSELQKQESTNSGSRDDDRFWKATVDKAGNGSAIIRFLPARDDDELPWVKLYSHGFQGPTGKWYIENCLTTIGQSDPVVEHCNELWNSGLEEDKKTVGKRKRRLSYNANVLVIKDPSNPENEGKVKQFKFGKKLNPCMCLTHGKAQTSVSLLPRLMVTPTQTRACLIAPQPLAMMTRKCLRF